MHPDRHIALEGASNFRDFGGYRGDGGRMVKWRRLFRSDRLSELTDADFARLADCRIRRILDLRRDSEAARAPTSWRGLQPPDVVRLPLFEDQNGPSAFRRMALESVASESPELARSIMTEMYFRMVSEPGPLAAFAKAFAQLASPGGLPALVHCSAGKDRTGVMCALILGALGVSRADIVEDFLLTRRFYDADANLRARVSQVIAQSDIGDWSAHSLAPVFSVEQVYIDRALDCVEAEGGAETFLTRTVGVPQTVLAALRAELLTETDA